MPAKVRRRKGRKLLAASVGVASMSFVGVGCNIGVANLMAAPSCEVAPQNPYCYAKPDAGSSDTGDGASADAASSQGDAATDAGDASGGQ